MAQTILTLQLAFSGKSPIAAGDKRLTELNIRSLLYALGHGSRYREPATSPYLQYQTGVVQATGTITCATVVGTNTASIGGQALTATQRRATGTLTAATAIVGNTCVINGVTFTGVAGAVVLGEATFSVDTGNTETATSLAAQINAYVDYRLSGIVAAKSAAAVVTLYAVNEGTSGNAITLVGTAVTLAASAATLANGAAGSNNTFDFAGTNATTAASLAAAINASTTAAVKQVTATVGGAGNAVVTVTSKVGGLTGNGIALASSGATLAVSAATLTSGAADAPLRFDF